MFRTLRLVSPVAMFGADVLSAPPDSAGSGAAPAGGGGSQPSGAADGGGADAGDFDDAGDAGDDLGDDAGDRGAGDPEETLEDLLVDDDDQDPAGQTRTEADRIKALSAKNRKLKRQLAKRLTTMKRVEGLDLDRVLSRASQYDELERAAARNPRLAALLGLGGGDAHDDDGRGRGRRGREDDDPPFDESKLPFNANENAINRYFADLAKANHELRRQFRALVGRLDGFERRDVQRSEGAVRSQWGAAVDAVSRHITDKKLAVLVQDAIRGAYNDPRVRSKYSAQQVLNHYLKEYGVNPSQANRARGDAASRQRIAERNKNLTRHPNQGGSPAPARNPKERLSDVRRRLAQTGR